MQEIIQFQHIHIELPFERILRRLGYRSGTTMLADSNKKEIEKKVCDAFDAMDLQGRAGVVSIEHINDEQVVLDDGSIFKSRKLAAFLYGSEKAVIAGVSAGKNIMEVIQTAVKNNNVSDAAIFDAAASEIVDDALGWILDNLRIQLRSQGEIVNTRRYSAGYGDFQLSNQAVFYSLLKLDELGVVLTPAFILLPEKTVTALAGIITLR
ncbi:MAG: hypothetical protein JW904_03995 [Spirochaetales bacterium]|nr:hypothetical protein [Spirochaetales bacterium]